MQRYQRLQGPKDLVQFLLGHDGQRQHRVVVGLQKHMQVRTQENAGFFKHKVFLHLLGQLQVLHQVLLALRQLKDHL